MNRYVVTVDEDIDYMNLEDVVWGRSAHRVLTLRSTRLPLAAPREQENIKLNLMLLGTGPTYNSRALIDACKPFEWMERIPRSRGIQPGVYRSGKKEMAATFLSRFVLMKKIPLILLFAKGDVNPPALIRLKDDRFSGSDHRL